MGEQKSASDRIEDERPGHVAQSGQRPAANRPLFGGKEGILRGHPAIRTAERTLTLRDQLRADRSIRSTSLDIFDEWRRHATRYSGTTAIG